MTVNKLEPEHDMEKSSLQYGVSISKLELFLPIECFTMSFGWTEANAILDPVLPLLTYAPADNLRPHLH